MLGGISLDNSLDTFDLVAFLHSDADQDQCDADDIDRRRALVEGDPTNE